MKNVYEFVRTMVKVEFIEQADCFGHYPFQLFCENKEGKFELNSLALNSVTPCYTKFADYKYQGSKRIYMALDFPKGGDIDKDFVAVFAFEHDELDLFAIPYDHRSGETFDVIKDSSHLDELKSQIQKYFNKG